MAYQDDLRLPFKIVWQEHADTIVAFNKVFYEANCTWKLTSWRGQLAFKAPTDFFILQELIWMCRPQVIVETGTACGGSALFYADIQTLAGIPDAQVLTIEKYPDKFGALPFDPRILAIHGDSTDPAVAEQVRTRIAGRSCMVILDSAHDAPHVLKELELYAGLVTVGHWLIVEDTNLNTYVPHPTKALVPGPAEALAEWLPTHPEFQPDSFCERYLLTFNPGGFLCRRA